MNILDTAAGVLRRRTKSLVALALSGGIALLVLVLWLAGTLDGLENRFLDYRFVRRGAVPPPPDIVVVDINDRSIEELGRWPWPRNVYGELVSRLEAAGARAVVFDILFTEPDTHDPLADRYFGGELSRAGNAVLGAFFRDQGTDGSLARLALPVPPLRDGVRTGFVNILPDPDGIVRRVRLLAPDARDGLIPSIALAGLARSMDRDPVDLLLEARLLDDEDQRLIINYYGPNLTFPYYPFHEVYAGRVDDEAFRDRIVLVGGTATALFDIAATPFSGFFQGVEVHANVIANLMNRDFLRPWPEWVTFLLIVGLALYGGFVLGELPALTGGLLALGSFAGYYYLVCWLFSSRDVAAAFVAPALSLSLSYVGVMFYRFTGEEQEKRRIKKMFSHYVSAQVMESLLLNPQALRLGGQRRDLTVLFSDIRGFTTLSEAMPPENVVELLNEYLSRMVEVVFRYDGTLDKFIGDAVMAFWGAPASQSDHARRAVFCALDMMDELGRLREKWLAEGRKTIDIGIGINSGEMVVGNMGSRDKMEYTVIGDNVNLGSRLEGLNKEYRTHVIISESTRRLVEDIVEVRPLGAVRVKGRERPVEVFEVTGRKGRIMGGERS